MDVEILSRVQFAFTIAFHYLYPPLTIGLSVLMVIMEAMWLKTKNPRYHNMARFWTRVFGLIFAIGVATGIVMEFEFGTNWATYSRFVGDVFGSVLAAEGIFAFFLEAGFLSLLLFGWNRVGPGMHFFATCMVCLGAHFSAVWIIIANSWMQTPAGYRIELNGERMPAGYAVTADEFGNARAVVESFSEVLLNPSSLDRITHTLLGCYLAGAFLVISISAYYILRKRHTLFAATSMKLAMAFATLIICLQMVSGDSTARGVLENQPVKFAALEGVFETKPYTPIGIVGWVDSSNRETHAIQIPGLLSFLAWRDFETPVTGLNQLPPDSFFHQRYGEHLSAAEIDAKRPQYWPNVGAVFQFYHIMILIGVILFFTCMYGCWLWRQGRLFKPETKLDRLFLWFLVTAVLLPQIANQAGWFTAEMGRQPWIVYEIMRTSEGLSRSVVASNVLWSLIMFAIIYPLLFVLFMFLLNRKIQHGPDPQDESLELPDEWQEIQKKPRADA